MQMQTAAADIVVSKSNPSYGNSLSKDGKRRSRRRRNNKKALTDDIEKQSISAASTVPNNDKKHNQTKKSSDLSTLNLPQLKLVLRGIGDIDKHGTNEKMITLIKDLIESANNSITLGITEESISATPLALDEDSVAKVLSTSSEGKRVTDEENIRKLNELTTEVTHATAGGDSENKAPVAHVDDKVVNDSVNHMKSFRVDQSGTQYNKNAAIIRLLVSLGYVRQYKVMNWFHLMLFRLLSHCLS